MVTKKKKGKLGGAVGEARGIYRTRKRLSATEASRNFSEILNRALYRGESFLVERAGEPVVEIRPAASHRFTLSDLADLMSALPPVDEEYLRAVEELFHYQQSIPASPWEP